MSAPPKLDVLASYLLPYQVTWLQDRSKLKTWLKSRQIGATDVGQALDAVRDAILFPHDQYVMSYRMETAKEVLRDCVKWLEVFRLMGVHIPHVAKKTEIEFANGSRIKAIPGNPETARGARGTVRLDEAAFIKRSTEVWSALGALNASKDRYRAILTSTPFGESGLFYETHTSMEGWSCHETDIYEAVRDGLDRDIEHLRRLSFHFDREFLCKFAAGGKYFSKDFLLRAFQEHDPEPAPGGAPLEKILAVDLAKIHDMTEIVEFTRGPDRPFVSGHWMIESLDYRAQRHIIGDLANERGASTVVVDETKHPGTTDELRADLGETRVMGRIFTNKWKSRAYPEARKGFEHDAIGMDFDRSLEWDKESESWKKAYGRPLLDQLLKVEQLLSSSGVTRYEVKRDESGHGDGVSAFMMGHDYIKHGRPRSAAKAVKITSSKKKRTRKRLPFG